MEDEEWTPVKLTLNIPVISRLGREAATKLATATLMFEGPGGKEITPEDATDADVQYEAEKLSSLNEADRTQALKNLLAVVAMMFGDARLMSKEFLRIADQLDRARAELASLPDAVVVRRGKPPGKDRT